MDPVLVLLNAARRYCVDQADLWHRRYAELTAAGRERTTIRAGAWEYTVEAYAIFPRYQVLAAIKSDVEHFVPADFRSLDEVRSLLEMAGETARNDFTKYEHPAAVRAMEDERRRFVEFIQTADVLHLADLPILPFRRVLGDREHDALHAAFRRRWGTWYGGSVDHSTVPSNAVTLHTAVMEKPGAYDDLRRLLSDRGITRLVELREWGDGYELETVDASFEYNGAEGFWTAGEMSWMVYSSHEASITFGGLWLVEGMRRSLPLFDYYLYRGWDLEEYGKPAN